VRISVIGCGYLGAVHAAAMASLGHDVVGIDTDDSRAVSLSRGIAPFHEPGLPELLREGISSGRLTFSGEISDAIGARVHFLAIGTPQGPSGAADLSYLFTAVAELMPFVQAGDVVVGKSTVPVGVAARIAEVVESAGARLVWNPEFLREGLAIRDTLSPDRMVYGVRDGDNDSVAVLDDLYSQILLSGMPRMVTDFATSELVKVAANAFLATKISFINAMAEIAEVTGADITHLSDALGQDPRIGRRFLNSGLGFGGGCLPKDIRGFIARAEELGVGESVSFLREVEAINLRRRDRAVQLITDELGPRLVGATVAILGLAFKPDSDDVRDSPAIEVAKRLKALGAQVVATDPHAITGARAIVPDIEFRLTAHEAMIGADIVVVLTEWADYKELDPADIIHLVSTPTVVDARNCLDSGSFRAAGWRVISLGRAVPAELVAV
jgi:UDPglucose 6-dehydrogenase